MRRHKKVNASHNLRGNIFGFEASNRYGIEMSRL
jgi:hypothetical protein